MLDRLRTRFWVFIKPLVELVDVVGTPSDGALPAMVSVEVADMPVRACHRSREFRALTGLPGPIGNRLLSCREILDGWETNTLPCSRNGRHSLTH